MFYTNSWLEAETKLSKLAKTGTSMNNYIYIYIYIRIYTHTSGEHAQHANICTLTSRYVYIFIYIYISIWQFPETPHGKQWQGQCFMFFDQVCPSGPQLGGFAQF